MDLWMPLIAIGVVKVVCALIDWRVRVAYERARAAAVVEILRASPGAIRLQDKRADGTVLDVQIPWSNKLDQNAELLVTGRDSWGTCAER
jgi:hypothetical protein